MTINVSTAEPKVCADAGWPRTAAKKMGDVLSGLAEHQSPGECPGHSDAAYYHLFQFVPFAYILIWVSALLVFSMHEENPITHRNVSNRGYL